MKKDKKGFSVIEIVILVSIGGVIVLSGLFVFANLDDKDPTLVDNGSDNTQAIDAENDNTSGPDPEQVDVNQILSKELADKKFLDATAAVEAYCQEQEFSCTITLLHEIIYEGRMYAKIFDTGVVLAGYDDVTAYYIVTNEKDGWQFNFLAPQGCKTGTDHPGLYEYCSGRST